MHAFRMMERSPTGKLLGTLLWAAILLVVCPGASEAQQRLSVSALPTGLRPAGVAFGSYSPIQPLGFIAVANSGEDSVSFFRYNSPSLPGGVALDRTLHGIPGPYAVADCNNPRGPSVTKFLITSPSDNSVTLTTPGSVITRFAVGRQPYSATCFVPPGQFTPVAVISNFGDGTLTLIDIERLIIIGTIPNVPGSRSLHGIEVRDGRIAWVV